MASYEATIKSNDVNGPCGLRFAPIQSLFSQFGQSPIHRHGAALPSGHQSEMPQMDEMALYEATIKSRNVNGAYGLGFTPIQQLFS